MTEKEKMLRGMLYAPAHDETLLAELAACKAQCQQFNQRAYQAEGIESAQMLLRRLLGAAGEGLRIEPPFWCDYGRHITIGVHRKDWNHEDYYPAFVEYGHGGPAPAPAHPYIRPAYDTRVDEAYEIIRDGLRDAIDRL